jgi:hypothetical protein
MIAFPSMLVGAAKRAGIEVPANDDEVDRILEDHGLCEKYIKFYIFCLLQLGASMPYASVHFDNARVIAEIPDDQIKTITIKDVFDMGFQIGDSSMYA